MSGEQALDRWISELRKATRGLGRVMPDIVKHVRIASRKALLNGMSLDGIKWELTQDGRVPMKGAAAALRVSSVGSSILLAIGEPYVFHHFGAGGRPVRPIFPEGALPDLLGNAIRLGAIEVLPFTDRRRREHSDPVLRKKAREKVRAIKKNIKAKRQREKEAG